MSIEDFNHVASTTLSQIREGLQPSATEQPWMVNVCQNALLEDARRRSRTPNAALPPDEPPPPEPTPEIIAFMGQALNKLAPLQREALVLTKQGGLSLKDAAQVLGTTETAVKLRIHRAYTALRNHYRRHLEARARLIAPSPGPR